MPMIGAGGGPLFAALVSRKRRQILAAFHDRAATSPDTALTLEELRLSPGLILTVQRLRGVVTQADSGRFYLDLAGEARAQRTRRVTVLVVFAILAISLTAVWVLGRS